MASDKKIFNWDPARYSLKIEKMDNEHKILIFFMNELYVKFDDKKDKADVSKSLNALVNYTVQHFKDEEAYMTSIKFPDLEVHKAVHKNLLEKFGTYKTEFERTGVLTENFFSFLKTWLSAHICGNDMKYSVHAQKSSGKMAA
jgi:hemerythrin-like metal-binding protein